MTGSTSDTCSTPRRAIAKTDGIDREAFDEGEDRKLAVVHLLQTLNEAARRVSIERRQAYLEIPWRDIVAMRHKTVHDYFEVNEDVVWNVATNELSTLIPALARLLPDEPEGA